MDIRTLYNYYKLSLLSCVQCVQLPGRRTKERPPTEGDDRTCGGGNIAVCRACKLVLQANQFVVIDEILYYVDPTHRQQMRAVVPEHLRSTLLELNHSGSHWSPVWASTACAKLL